MAEFIIYNTVGFPDPDKFMKFMVSSAKYVDGIELGIPPKFAKYDGPTIRRSYSAARKNTQNYVELIKKVSSASRIIAPSYLDGLDLESFLNDMNDAKVKAVLFPDLLIDHLNELSSVAQRVRGKLLKSVIFVTPSVPDSIMRSASFLADEFVYLGIRPTTGVQIPVNVTSLVKRVKGIVHGRLIAGFGLKDNSEIAQAIGGGADGVAVGTSIMKVLEENGVEDAINEVRRLSEYVRSL